MKATIAKGVRRYLALYSKELVEAAWASDAKKALVEELDDRNIRDRARVDAAFRAASDKSPAFPPRPAAILAILAETTGDTADNGRRGRPGCEACRHSGFREICVVRPDRTTGVPFCVDCYCHKGRDPLSMGLPAHARAGSTLAYTSSLRSQVARPETNAMVQRFQEKGLEGLVERMVGPERGGREAQRERLARQAEGRVWGERGVDEREVPL